MNKTRLYIGLGAAVMLLCALLLLAGMGLSLVNLPGLILVLGGTYLASVIAHGNGRVIAVLRKAPAMLRDARDEASDDQRPFLRVADAYRRGDVRGAEGLARALADPYLREGVHLALDARNGEEILQVLQWRIRHRKEQDGDEVRIFRTMSTFAPAFGMLGTLLGLVSLLDDLSMAGLEQIGVSMGFALMSTLYGLLAANLLFRPLALKLEGRSRRAVHHMGFWLDALIMLHERRHPVLIGEYLASAGTQPAPAEAKPALAEVRALALGRT